MLQRHILSKTFRVLSSSLFKFSLTLQLLSCVKLHCARENKHHHLLCSRNRLITKANIIRQVLVEIVFQFNYLSPESPKGNLNYLQLDMKQQSIYRKMPQYFHVRHTGMNNEKGKYSF